MPCIGQMREEHGVSAVPEVLLQLWPVAGNKEPRGHSMAPPPAEVGRRIERKRQKLVGPDKDSLTEQQTK